MIKRFIRRKIVFCLLMCATVNLATKYFWSSRNELDDSRIYPDSHVEAVNVTSGQQETDALKMDQFLEWYQQRCSEYSSNATVPYQCPCLPPTLVGEMNVSSLVERLPTLNDIAKVELIHANVMPGGKWQPAACTARQKVAVIVPFRDRELQLPVFLLHMHGILQRQQLDYRIFIVEQGSPEIFNKASIMNAGFLEARMLDSFDCFVFHDVDMLSEDDRHMYTCMNKDRPRHIGAYVKKNNYTMTYKAHMGGVTAFTHDQFVNINGYSNRYSGWGGEDDDMWNRVKARQELKLCRYPNIVSRYTMLKHERDKRNPFNEKKDIGFSYRPRHYPRDGVNTIRYNRTVYELRPLYTWIKITLLSPANIDFDQLLSFNIGYDRPEPRKKWLPKLIKSGKSVSTKTTQPPELPDFCDSL